MCDCDLLSHVKFLCLYSIMYFLSMSLFVSISKRGMRVLLYSLSAQLFIYLNVCVWGGDVVWWWRWLCVCVCVCVWWWWCLCVCVQYVYVKCMCSVRLFMCVHMSVCHVRVVYFSLVKFLVHVCFRLFFNFNLCV